MVTYDTVLAFGLLMRFFKIVGGASLHGEVTLSGSKNAALPILSASLLTDNPVTISNVPNISDIKNLSSCLAALGKSIDQQGANKITLSSSSCESLDIPEDQARQIRGSILLLGPLIARHHKVILPLPGGCSIGKRLIDQHIMALQALGVDIVEYDDCLECTRLGARLRANTIAFTSKTVTGTENAIMAAVLAEGTSIISNAASEPEVQDLINFLNAMGARISWMANDMLQISGVEELSGCENYTIIGDRIEAGTFLVAAAITGGSLCVRGLAPDYLESCLKALETIGAGISRERDTIHLDMSKCQRKPFHLVTQPYPGFPTDLQSLFLSLATTLDGESSLDEKVFDNRFQVVKELQKMGATIALEGNKAVISGQTRLQSATVRATDLRSGAALVCAALAAKGTSLIIDIHHILRGYEELELKLRLLGANIENIHVDEPAPFSIINQSFFNTKLLIAETNEPPSHSLVS